MVDQMFESIIFLLVTTTYAQITPKHITISPPTPLPDLKENLTLSQNNFKNWTFKDYIRKFDPGVVWERIDREKKMKGANLSAFEELDTFINGIDETDELLKLKVENGNAKLFTRRDGRRWVPPGDVRWHGKDRDAFSLRPRLYELMKQAIYQARDKMVIMQIIRTKYNTSPLYKMGFLFSKTDNQAKVLSSFAYRAFKYCTNARQKVLSRYPLLDFLQANERLFDLWFDVELLADVILMNHKRCEQLLEEHDDHRLEKWQFID